MSKITLEIKNKLRTTLSRLFEDKKQVNFLLTVAGEETANYDLNGSVNQVWHLAIEELEKRNSIEKIVDSALEEYPEDDSLKEIKFAINDNLSADKLNMEINNVLSVLPEIGLSDSYLFISDILDKSDTFLKDALEKIKSEYENTVNQFDVLKISEVKKSTQQKVSDFLIQVRTTINSMGDLPAASPIALPKAGPVPKGVINTKPKDLTWLSKSIKASKSVGLVRLENGSSSSGILLKGGYLLCPNFLIDKPDQIRKSKLVLGFDEETSQTQESFDLDDSVFYTSELKPFEESKFYSLVKIKDQDRKLEKWGFLDIEYFSDPMKGDPINIIHHPKGGIKSIGSASNIKDILQDELIYDLKTTFGSSGGALVNQEFKLIGMHVRKFSFGNAQPIASTPYRAGVLIKSVLVDLKNKIPKSKWSSFPFLQFELE